MSLLQNLGTNCSTGVQGSALGKCTDYKLGDIKAIAFLEAGTTITAFNQTIFEGLIKDGKLHLLKNVEDVEVSNNENDEFTSSQGFVSRLRGAKPIEIITFRKSLCFDKRLNSFVSNGAFEVVKFFEKGVLIATKKDGSVFKGFELGMVDKQEYSFLAGSEQEMSKLKYQYTDNIEKNSYHQILRYEDLNFDPLSYEGVLQGVIQVVSSSATTKVIKIVDACNSSLDYTTLIPDLVTSFTMVGGVISTVVLTNGNLEITHNGTPTSLTLNIVEDVDGNYYKTATNVLA